MVGALLPAFGRILTGAKPHVDGPPVNSEKSTKTGMKTLAYWSSSTGETKISVNLSYSVGYAVFFGLESQHCTPVFSVAVGPELQLQDYSNCYADADIRWLRPQLQKWLQDNVIRGGQQGKIKPLVLAKGPFGKWELVGDDKRKKSKTQAEGDQASAASSKRKETSAKGPKQPRKRKQKTQLIGTWTEMDPEFTKLGKYAAALTPGFHDFKARLENWKASEIPRALFPTGGSIGKYR
ncbi:hypothetical protein B0H14DRAFT_2565363 [Mycena olivaceomarginata]|nr:hypothetical protein B0H14DRAFT_2565363 [Mycena olivaceomarginata]